MVRHFNKEKRYENVKEEAGGAGVGEQGDKYKWGLNPHLI